MKRGWPLVCAAGVLVLAVAVWACLSVATSGSRTASVGVVESASGLIALLAGAIAVGFLAVGCVCLSPELGELPRALDSAAVSAGAMTVFSATAGLASAAHSRPWLIAALIGAVTTALCVLIRTQGGAAFLLGLAIAALWPLAQATASDGPDRPAPLMIHTAFSALWLGGAAAIVMLRPSLGRARWALVVRRFRPLGWASAFAVVLSGIALAVARSGAGPGLPGAYGVLLAVKAAILLVLAGLAVAAWSRRRPSPGEGPSRSGSTVPRFVITQVALLAVAFGVSAVLPGFGAAIERVSPDASPAQLLSGSPLPAPLTVANAVAGWAPLAGAAIGAALGAAFYLAGVLRLRTRGHRWPIRRTVAWLCGMALAAYLSSGGIAAYRPYLFSVHLNVQLVWALGVPLLATGGAPLALLRQSSMVRSDGSRGAREWVEAISSSRVVRFLVHPVCAAVFFVGSVWLFAVGPLLRWSVMNSFGQGWAQLQLLAGGLLFAVAIARARRRLGLRLLVLTGSEAALVAIAVWAAVTDSLLVADWFGAMGRTWGPTPLEDQRTGAIVFGVFSAIFAFALAFAAWRRSRSAADPVSRRVL